ncbi:hypothetical protein CcrC1_gp403 [Caulobacter phage C1]|nr:hypothetical protein CcrC1_gp403 [Caulobacter phage C1]UTU08632.1 hypothetical protein CcrC2_gp404 [Caulobacter phage C2]UTU10264.1 hypothetical protein CcrRB23_gp402 [Caulobacter phage RB23]UXY92607.1 hypothetical protein CcrJ4_gp398 [Caulobacter phage J4]WGN97298.1 hypothetical protein [Bertelyvirus sp.]
MRYDRIVEHHVKMLYKRRYGPQATEMDIPTFDAEIARLRGLQERCRARDERKAAKVRWAEHVARMLGEMAFAHRVIHNPDKREPLTLMAFDIEQTMDGVLEEVGVAILRRGVMLNYNYRLAGAGRTHDFHFGSTTYLHSLAAFQAVLEVHAAGVDYYAGQSLNYDFDRLKAQGIVLPRRAVFDVGHWSTIESDNKEMTSLEASCARHGIDTSGMHCGGNDAAYTLQLMLAMIDEHIIIPQALAAA